MQQQKNGPGISSVDSIYLRHKLSRFIVAIKKIFRCQTGQLLTGIIFHCEKTFDKPRSSDLGQKL